MNPNTRMNNRPPQPTMNMQSGAPKGTPRHVTTVRQPVRQTRPPMPPQQGQPTQSVPPVQPMRNAPPINAQPMTAPPTNAQVTQTVPQQPTQTVPQQAAQPTQSTLTIPKQAAQTTQTVQQQAAQTTQTVQQQAAQATQTVPRQATQTIPQARPASQRQTPNGQHAAARPNGVPRKNPRQKKKRIPIALIVTLSVIGVLLLGVGISAAVALGHTPDADDDVPFVTVDPSIDNSSDNLSVADLGDAPKASVGAYTRRDGVYNFLIAGLDAEGGNHTDVLLVVSYDTINGSASILSIPRDTYINVGRNFSKINSFYTGDYNVAVKNGLRGADARSSAMEGLCSLLEQNLNIKLDYWAMMDLEGFRGIVDAFGGVEIEIAQDMYYVDPYQDLHIDLKAGKQVLDGETAEQFVRFRDGYTEADIGRINAQKIFISAFLDTVKSKISIDIIDDLIREAVDHVLTSIDLLDCIYFAKAALTTLDMSNINMMTLPSEGVTNPTTGAWYEVIHRKDALEMINTYFNVYEREITDDIFDIDRVFTNDKHDYINDIYLSEAENGAAVESAEAIDENSVQRQSEAFKQ